MVAIEPGHAGPDATQHMVTAAALQHDGVNAIDCQQLGEKQPGRPSSDDSHPGSHQRRASAEASTLPFSFPALLKSGPIHDIKITGGSPPLQNAVSHSRPIRNGPVQDVTLATTHTKSG